MSKLIKVLFVVTIAVVALIAINTISVQAGGGGLRVVETSAYNGCWGYPECDSHRIMVEWVQWESYDNYRGGISYRENVYILWTSDEYDYSVLRERKDPSINFGSISLWNADVVNKNRLEVIGIVSMQIVPQGNGACARIYFFDGEYTTYCHTILPANYAGRVQ